MVLVLAPPVEHGRTKAKKALEVWLPAYQQADRESQLGMFTATMSIHLPKIRWQLPLLDLYTQTLDMRVQATTAMAFGDVGEARKLQAAVVFREQRFDAAIEIYSTGGGWVYVLRDDRGLLVRQLEGQSLLCIWLKAEDAEVIRSAGFRGRYRVSPMSYRELESQLQWMQSGGMRTVLVDQTMNDGGRVVPTDVFLDGVRQQITAAESSESGRAIKHDSRSNRGRSANSVNRGIRSLKRESHFTATASGASARRNTRSGCQRRRVSEWR